MRALPVRVHVYPAETVSSVFTRLATANHVPTGELWTSVRRHQAGLQLRTMPELAPERVAELAGLPNDYFRHGRRCDRLFARCAHNDWRYSNCPTCAPRPAPVTMCQRCAGGELVYARIRSGPVCVKHRRWHYDGQDIDLTNERRHLRAERCFTGMLWERGIGLETGEIELATDLLSAKRRLEGRLSDVPSYSARLRVLYPDVIALVELLTEPWAVQFLSNRKLGHVPVALLVDAAVAAVESRSARAKDELRGSFVARGREANVRVGRMLRLRHGQSPERGEFGTHLLEYGPRLRAVFLRHTNARRPQWR